MRYGIYVRVSTDKDEQISSVVNQAEICRNWIERNGYEWDENAVYKDEGISGTVFTERPAIQLILQKAKRKELDMVVFKSISRLARDLKDSLEIREVLLAHNVRIISVEEAYDSDKAGKNDISFELWSMFSAQYSRTLSSSISAAIAAKVRRGDHAGGVPYGYDYIEKKLVVNEKEAALVREMFNWYIEGYGFKKIAHMVNNRGIRTKKGGLWSQATVQGLIRNRTYTGDFALNQYTSVKVGGRKKQIKNPEEKWLVFPNHHPAIITHAVWEQANSKEFTKSKRKIAAWNEFRGFTRCGQCGSLMSIITSNYTTASGDKTIYKLFKCIKYKQIGKYACFNHTTIHYHDFREFILQRLEEEGTGVPLQIETGVERQRQEDIQSLQKRVDALQKKRKKVLQYALEEIITKEELQDERAAIDTELEECEKKIFTLQQQETKETNIEEIRKAFEQLENREQDLYHVFQTLIKDIRVYRDGTVDIAYTFSQ